MEKKLEKGKFYARVRFDRRQEWEWRIPEFSVTLRIRRSALEELRSTTVTALGTVHKRGNETGGVVIGNFKPGLLQILSFREVASEEPGEASYRINETEAAQLFAGSDSDGGTPLAFWRSNLREQPMPDAYDTAIAGAAAVPNMVLLVEPKLGGEARLFCCVRDTNGAWFVSEPSAPILPDPETDRKLLQQLTGDGQEISAPVRVTRESNRTLVWAGAFLLLSLLVAMLPFAVSARRASAAPEHSYAELGLRLERAGAGLRLRWNPTVPAVASAVGGSLHIKDGELQRSVELDADQTRSGMIVYVPDSDDIELRLEVYGEHSRYLGENTRVILAKQPHAGNKDSAARSVPEN